MQRSLKAEYTRLAQHREPFLRRAWDASRLTIPGLLPEDNHTGHSKLPTPYQGVGAQGVGNLTAKLLLAVLPPSQPFFQLQPSVFDLEAQLGEKVKTEVEESLVKVEKAVQAEVDSSTLRLSVFEALKHLVVAGNSLLVVPDKGLSRVMHLDQYVLERAPDGTVERIITKELTSKTVVSDVIAALAMGPHASGRLSLTQQGGSTAVNTAAGGTSAGSLSNAEGDHTRDDSPDKTVEIYTCIKRVEKEGYEVWQEVSEQLVPGSEGSFKGDNMPYIPLRFSQISGESYGRGLVEELMGDLVSLEGLAKSIVEASAAMARLLFLVDPSSTINPDDLNRAPNGSFRQGRADEVTALQVGKAADMTIAANTAREIETRLNRAFLLNTAVQRQAERVTAQEIRFVAQELESALGGVFSALSRELQLPLVNRIMALMKKAGKLPPIPNETVTPKIVTGMAALGRAVELQNINTFAQSAVQIAGPDGLAKYLNLRPLLGQLAVASGVDTTEILKTQEEVEAAEQAAMQQAQVQALGPDVIKAVGPAAVEQFQQSQADTQE